MKYSANLSPLSVEQDRSIAGLTRLTDPGFLSAIYYQVMNSQTVNIDEAKNQLSELITIASEGGEVIIVQDGKTLARLVPPAGTSVYRSLPPTRDEFSTDDEPLAWEAEGWENVA